MKSVLTLIRLILVAISTVVCGVSTILLRPLDPHGKIFNAIGRVWAKSILLIASTRVVTRGTEHIKNGTSYIYVSNHASLLDIPAVMAGVPDQIRLVYKKELEKIPIFGWILRIGPNISIERERSFSAMKSLEQAAEKIKRGASVLLFAEGTRSSDGRLQPFKRGAFSLAVKTGIPIIPLTINGSYDRRPKGKFLINPGTIELILDEPIPTDNGTGKEFEISIMNRVYGIIQSRFKEPRVTA
jgi:1-acyl-sn-glycerol-3-phosphate acyltransferase